jgi:hypothetical protein
MEGKNPDRPGMIRLCINATDSQVMSWFFAESEEEQGLALYNRKQVAIVYLTSPKTAEDRTVALPLHDLHVHLELRSRNSLRSNTGAGVCRGRRVLSHPLRSSTISKSDEGSEGICSIMRLDLWWVLSHRT